MKELPLPNTFVYEFDIDDTLVDESLNFFLDEHDKFGSTFVNGMKDSMVHSDLVISHDDKGRLKANYYKPLFEELQKCIDEVCNLHFENTQLAICDAWMTKSTFGKSLRSHYHSYSIFSGLVYLTEHKNSNTVFELNDIFFEKNQSIFSHTIKKRTYKLSYKPKKGKVLIWRSDLLHHTEPNNDKQVRYTLSFNTWPTGIINDSPAAGLKLNVESPRIKNE